MDFYCRTRSQFIAYPSTEIFFQFIEVFHHDIFGYPKFSWKLNRRWSRFCPYQILCAVLHGRKIPPGIAFILSLKYAILNGPN